MLAGSVAVLGGCLGGTPSSDGTETNGTVTDETDGYPPPSETTPEPRSIDPDSFERLTVEGTSVPLAPIDAVYHWYRRRAARFADARGESAYRTSHIRGAVLSPAPDGGESDVVGRWPTDARIVCYCGCPHHLSSLRAASLVDAGYEDVYVIDEGFWAWHDRGYPMAGDDVSAEPALREIVGRVDPTHAGETAWAWHEPSGQREATGIDEGGRYRLELRFADVELDSTILVETPAYRVRAPLDDLVDAPVTGEPAG